MGKDNTSNNLQKKVIIDSTLLIHLDVEKLENFEGYKLLIPEEVRDELKSKKAIFNLTLIEEMFHPIYTSASHDYIKAVKKIAIKTGDLIKLSDTDIAVIALALEHKGALVLTDDKAIQNVCHEAKIEYKSLYFQINKKRIYFWKCTVCGKKYENNVKKCLKCGSPVKRYYTYKRL